MDFADLNNVEDIEINTLASSEIEIDILKVNPYQPRLKDTDTDELEKSIEKNGQLQPIIVNQDNFIVGGHRRYFACKKLGKETIKYTRVSTTKLQLYTYALIENEERENLTDIELALSYNHALDEKLFSSAKELAKSLNKSESHVTKVRNLLKLPQEIQDDIRKNNRKPSVETLNIIMKIEDINTMIDLYYKYIHGEINRSYIKDYLSEQKAKDKIFDDEPIKLSNNKLKVTFDLKHLDNNEKETIQEEIQAILDKYGVLV